MVVAVAGLVPSCRAQSIGSLFSGKKKETGKIWINGKKKEDLEQREEERRFGATGRRKKQGLFGSTRRTKKQERYGSRGRRQKQGRWGSIFSGARRNYRCCKGEKEVKQFSGCFGDAFCLSLCLPLSPSLSVSLCLPLPLSPSVSLSGPYCYSPRPPAPAPRPFADHRVAVDHRTLQSTGLLVV